MHTYSIIVTGNGYDLAQGYPTKYEDFYNKVKESIEMDENSFKIKNQSFENVDNFYKFANKLKDNDNLFLKYILGVEKIYKRWCDFEDDLKKILETFDYVLTNGGVSNLNMPQHLYFSLNNKMLVNLFDKRITGGWKDLALNIANSTTGFVYYRVECQPGYFNSTNNEQLIKRKIIEYLDSDLDNFKTLFIFYMQIYAKAKPNKHTAKYKAHFVFTYNYTECSKSLCEGTFINLHGNIKNNEIVLGVDDTTNFSNKGLIRHTKLTQQSLLENVSTQSILDGMIDPFPTIAYFGLSFNESDKSSILDFFEVENATHHIYCLNRQDKKEIAANLQGYLGTNKYSKILKEGRMVYFDSNSFFK